MAAQPHPVRLTLTDDLHRSRLTVFFRLLLTIPHLLWLALFTVGAGFVAFVNWWATLFTGHSPKGLHDFLAGYVRYATMVFAYLFLAANPWPPFYVAGPMNPYPVDVEIAGPERQNRWITGFRLFLALPALLMAGAMAGGGASANSRGGTSGGVATIASMFTWFSALIRGRAPRGLRDFMAWGIAYTAQVYAYLFLLTDRYPNTDPAVFFQTVAPPDPEGRARLENTDDLRRSRLTVFFRLVLAFPHIIWLLLWTILALLAAIANWFFTLFAGRAATPLARFLGAFIRYNAHVGAFFWLVANPFPGFVGAAGTYPVEPEFPAGGRQNRWITGFKIILALPALFLNGAIGWLIFLSGILTWFYALILGRAPAGLQRTGAYTIGYGAQLNCYLFSLTDRYPHSSPLVVFGSPPGAAGPALSPPSDSPPPLAASSSAA